MLVLRYYDAVVGMPTTSKDVLSIFVRKGGVVYVAGTRDEFLNYCISVAHFQYLF